MPGYDYGKDPVISPRMGYDTPKGFAEQDALKEERKMKGTDI